MPAYVVVQVRVTDPAKYDRYRPVAAAAIAKHGGRYIVRGGASETLEGQDATPPFRRVVVEFPSMDAARRFWTSAEYAEAKAIRAGAGEMLAVLCEGYAG
jgi:uncharacterized protein (DUF1330 family)